MTYPQAHEYVFNRPPRIYRTWRMEGVELPEPPVQPMRHEQGGLLTYGVPLMSAGVMVGASAAASQGSNGLLFAIPMVAMALTGIGTTVLTQRAQAKRDAAEFAQRQRFFEEQLRQEGARLQALCSEEGRVRREAHPSLEEIQRIAGAFGQDLLPQERLWERRIGDPDFLALALGYGSMPFSSTITVPRPQRDSPVDERLFQLQQRYATLSDVPITLALPEVGSLSVAGPRSEGLAMLRALIWQAAVFHAPTDLRLAVIYPRHAADDWRWVPWLPHTTPFSNDAAFGARMHASEDAPINQLMSTLLDQLSRRRDLQHQQRSQDAPPPSFTPIVVIVDGVERVRDQPVLSEIMRDGPRYNMLALFLVHRWEDTPSECGAMLDLGPAGPRWMRAGQQWSCEPFTTDTGEATVRNSDRLARKLARIKLAESGSNQDVPRSVRLFDLLQIKDEQDLELRKLWQQPLKGDRIWHADVPIGQKAGKQPLLFDLNEDQHGSHGIIAGATGAGKSVLLQSVIAALAIKHSPQQMQLLLIDFKGGASLAMLARLPHTIGFVTDLEGRLAERAMTAIKSELRRRKLLFRKAEECVGSQVEKISQYREKREQLLARQAEEQGSPKGEQTSGLWEQGSGWLEPLPNLLIVIDEFDEMVQSYREFMAELVRVVKQGRSLGVHLLVASQQPSKAVTDDISTQLKYFMALRLGSSEDSRQMLTKPDAAFLPTDIPGRAYFRVGGDSLLFQVAQVTGAYQPRGGSIFETVDDVIVMDEAGPRGDVRPTPHPRPRSRDHTTDLDVLVRALGIAGPAFFAAAGWQPRPIWQPPLASRIALSQLCGTSSSEELPRHILRDWQQPPERSDWLQITLGCLDIPQESAQQPLRISLSDAHLAVVGASGSGKTMLLRTLLLSLALTHGPQDVWCYVIDGGGQGLKQLADLPHVATLIQARERERIRRLVELLDREILRRQELFRTVGASDLPAYRRDQGQQLPAWVVVIDKLALLREEFKDNNGYETITEELVRLARVGRTYGIHFVITADSVRDMSHQLLALFDMRIALRLPELHDYSELLGGRVTAHIPATLPGRGLCMRAEQGILELHIALPLLERPAPASRNSDRTTRDDDQATVLESELNAELKETVDRIRDTWERTRLATTVHPTPVMLLPEQLTLQHLDLSSLRQHTDQGVLTVPLSRDVDGGIGSLHLSAHTPHGCIIGGPRSGKTTTLQSIICVLALTFSPQEVRFIVIDPRRGLRGLCGLPHIDTYATSEAEVQAAAQRIAHLRTEPEPRGLQTVVVIDDYDIGYKTTESQFRSSYEGLNLFGALKQLVLDGTDSNIHLIAAANIKYPEEVGEVVRNLDAARNGVILWPNKYDSGTHLLDVALPFGERNAHLPPGRALLVQEHGSVMVQIVVIPPSEVAQLVAAIRTNEQQGEAQHGAAQNNGLVVLA